MPRKKCLPIISQTDFPMYFVGMLGEKNILVAGGGGQAKTGVPNAIDILDLRAGDGGQIEAIKLKHHPTSMAAIMNGTIVHDGKDFLLAGGEDGDCQIYRIKYQLLKEQQQKSDSSLRKRKSSENNTDSVEPTTVTFNITSEERVTTDTTSGGGFQKAVCFSSNLAIMVTGGADGFFRVWQYPGIKKLFEKKAHTNEIDDLHISPDNKQVVTVSKDNTACIWNLKTGDKFCNLQWANPGKGKYRYRCAKYGVIISRDGKIEKSPSNLFTAQIPTVRDSNAQPCYLTRWESKAYRQVVTVPTGKEILSALTVSDNGIYVGVGTISGSVSIYIAFSLQKLYHLSECHSIFVTGLQFVPSSTGSRCLMGASECSLISVSADKSIQLHQVIPSGSYSGLWVVIGAVIIILFLFVLLPSIFTNI